MKVSSRTKDIVSELLQIVINFTNLRQKLLIANINNSDSPAFVPKDLPVHEFSRIISCALQIYPARRSLVLYDTKHIKFKRFGTFSVTAVADFKSEKLLTSNRDVYLQTQIDKLMENALNQRVAKELLRQKQGFVSIFTDR